MGSSDFREKVKEVISEILGVPVKEIAPTANFIEDLGGDEEKVRLMIERFEGVFSIIIFEEDAREIVNLKTAIEHIAELI